MKALWIFVGTAVFLAAGLFAQDDEFIETRNERFDITSSKPLEVVLKVDAGEVTVESGESKAAAVSMEYDKAEFFSDVELNAKNNRLEIHLDKKHWFRWHKSEEEKQNLGSEIKLTLPTGVDISLDCRVKAGETTLRLGGLRIKELSVETWAGETEVGFDQPNPIVMDFLDVEAKIGEFRLIQLGNARFQRAILSGGIGEMHADFSGAAVPDSKARINLSIGEASVILPDHVGSRLEIGGAFSFMSKKNIQHTLRHRGRAWYSEGFDQARDKFFLYIKPGLGELNVETP
jgi:hypothetical protein